MITDWLRSHASKDAQIAQQAATIRELTDKLAVAEGRYNAQSVHLRQVEGQRDLQSEVNRQLVKYNTSLRERLAPFIARDRGPLGRFVSKTAGAAAQTAPAGVILPTTTEREAAHV